MADIIQGLKDQYGANSPAVAEQLNSIGEELQRKNNSGDARTALILHQEALNIYEWNKCNALLYDFVEKSKGYAVDMALTLRRVGNLLRDMNNFVGAAGTSFVVSACAHRPVVCKYPPYSPFSIESGVLILLDSSRSFVTFQSSTRIASTSGSKA